MHDVFFSFSISHARARFCLIKLIKRDIGSMNFPIRRALEKHKSLRFWNTKNKVKYFMFLSLDCVLLNYVIKIFLKTHNMIIFLGLSVSNHYKKKVINSLNC